MVASRRTANARSSNVIDRRYSSASGTTIDMQGVMGEYAVCLMLDLDPRKCIDAMGSNLCCAATDTFDLTVNGATIDVKCVRGDEEYPMLVTPVKAINPARFYCLVSVRNCPTRTTLPTHGPCRIVFEGAASGESVFQPDRLKRRYANKAMYEVPHEMLQPLVLCKS